MLRDEVTGRSYGSAAAGVSSVRVAPPTPDPSPACGGGENYRLRESPA